MIDNKKQPANFALMTYNPLLDFQTNCITLSRRSLSQFQKKLHISRSSPQFQEKLHIFRSPPQFRKKLHIFRSPPQFQEKLHSLAFIQIKLKRFTLSISEMKQKKVSWKQIPNCSSIENQLRDKNKMDHHILIRSINNQLIQINQEKPCLEGGSEHKFT